MGDYAYLNLTALKSAMQNTVAAHDGHLRRALEVASDQFDTWLERTLRTELATRYYTARYRDRLLLDADLLAVTTLKTLTDNSSGTRTYGDTWATTDYDLWPDNAALQRRPYTEIRANPGGTYWFPTDVRGVQIVGKWGWWESLETVASLGAEALDTSETVADVDAGGDFGVCDTILIDSEQMYVTAVAPTKLTVIRAVNGTTAATHSDNATIYRYRYPAPIAEAVGIHAARLYNRARTSPTGVSGSADVGFIRPVRLDADVRALIEPYRNLGA